MDHLWAPWRMSYIGAAAGPTPPACIFCVPGEEAGEDRDRLIVHRAEGAFTLLNCYPYNPGHLMVAAYGHGGDLAQMDVSAWGAVAAEVQLATRVVAETLRCDGFNGGWNQGRVAGAGFEGHLHVHLVPRWAGDTNFMPVLADVKVVPEHLDVTRDRLAEAFRGRS